MGRVTLRGRLERLIDRTLQPHVLVSAVLVLTAICFIWWPLVAPSDTDLWTHLDSGRAILRHRLIPRYAFWSFLTPARPWVDYAWLFQVLLYSIHAAAGYYGLLVLRALLYTLTAGLLSWYFLAGERHQTLRWYLLSLVLLYSCALIPRDLVVRPHLFSYFFLVLFICLLERRMNGLWCLPLLALLWVNLHGIEYPVMLLVVFSYAIEHLIVSRSQTPRTGQSQDRITPLLVLTALTIYLTPHMSRLLELPLLFGSSGAQDGFRYIRELMSLTRAGLFSFTSLPILSYGSLLSLLVILVLLGGAAAFVKRRVRISHALMAVGGAVLLTKGMRFIFEFALLSAPLMKHHPLLPGGLWNARMSRRGVVMAGGAMAVATGAFLHLVFGPRPDYPVSYRDVPKGVAAYLNACEIGGPILNHPDTGGYLRWALSPRYRIFMDMQFPHPFTELDLFEAAHAFSDEAVLGRVLAAYHPTCMAVPLTRGSFRELIQRFPDYVLVFFDDSQALYCDRSRHPEFAASAAVASVDPFELFRSASDPLADLSAYAALMKDVPRLQAVDPDGRLTNQVAGFTDLRAGAYERASRHADTVIRRYPELPHGFVLKGDALAGMHAWSPALSAYALALHRCSEASRPGIYKRMGFVYLRRHEMRKAYEALKRAVDPFDAGVTYQDLYWLGRAALQAGDAMRGFLFMRLALQKVPANESAWYARINAAVSAQH